MSNYYDDDGDGDECGSCGRGEADDHDDSKDDNEDVDLMVKLEPDTTSRAHNVSARRYLGTLMVCQKSLYDHPPKPYSSYEGPDICTQLMTRAAAPQVSKPGTAKACHRNGNSCMLRNSLTQNSKT